MNLTDFIGRLHPLVVHLPIGILLLAGVFYFLGRKEQYAFLNKALPVTLFFSALSAIGAAFLGWLLASGGGYEGNTMFWHRWLGIGVAVLSTFAWWQLYSHQKLQFWLLSTILIALTITGHLGGALTHGEDYLMEPLRAEKETAVINFANSPDSVVIYSDVIVPILEAKCYSCHNENKQNGGLNLSTWEGIQHGGDGGKVLASDAWESELFKRVILPQTSKKFMPPKGEPLTFGETSLLKWWILEGAKQDTKVSEVEALASVKHVLLHDYQLDLTPKPFVETVKIAPLDEEILEEILENDWKVNTLATDNYLLEISPKRGTVVTIEKLSLLLKAKSHITWLNLGGTGLSNDELQVLSQFTNLSRLRIEQNNITDKGLEQLSTLQHLESLNLYGNPVTDNGLKHLKAIPALKRVYLWQTQVTKQGLAALQNANTNLELK